ncbi:tyrosine-type recombinase/integrase [Yunchengibacter salinarum]|uniref:tyrosine-type recombinase/integrase n=1 Tax=Yunchengibacter salinarum TaxID=3133399 RepID=UPI0035B65986
MPRAAKELTAAEVRRIAAPGFHAVGGVAGLGLRVSPTGASRSWVLRYYIGGRRKNAGLGRFPDVTLAQARERAREFRDQLWQGVDPVTERRKKQAALIAEQAAGLTFEEAARQCHAARESEYRNAKHRKEWITTLERHAFPAIGRVSVDAVDLPHVLKVLEPIWHTRTETASRIRQRMEAVLTWATVTGHRKGENPARWRGNLKEVLPAPNKIAKARHHSALPWQRLPAFMDALHQREGMAARALAFTILTAARSGETRKAEWAEIDLKARVWTVPGERMKAGRPHRVPLSDAAVALLQSLPRMDGNPLVFPAPRGGVMTDMTMAAVVKRMHQTAIDAGGEGWTDPTTGRPVTVHGFRSTFKDWARNRTSYPDEISELALAHVNNDATRAAYARDELLAQRARLMGDWATFCTHPFEAGADVVSIGSMEK